MFKINKVAVLYMPVFLGGDKVALSSGTANISKHKLSSTAIAYLCIGSVPFPDLTNEISALNGGIEMASCILMHYHITSLHRKNNFPLVKKNLSKINDLR